MLREPIVSDSDSLLPKVFDSHLFRPSFGRAGTRRQYVFDYPQEK